MKATEQYFHVVLLNMLYKVVLTFKFVDVTRASEFQITASKHAQLSVPTCDHSFESYLTVLLNVALSFAVFCQIKF